MKIFAEGDLAATLRAQFTKARQEIAEENRNRLLNVDESEYIDYLVSKYRIVLLKIHWDKIEASEREEVLKQERFISGLNVDRAPPRPRQILTYHIPFSGDAPLLRLAPSSRVLWTTEVSVAKGEIRVDVVNWNNDPEEIIRQANQTLEHIRKQSESVDREVVAWNEKLKAQIRKLVEQRKKELLKQSEVLHQLHVPIRESPNVPATFQIPISRVEPIIRKPKSSAEPYRQDPVLDQRVYERILEVCLHTGREIERLPSVYQDKDEPALRDFLIMTLSPHFQSVSGETFNKGGKTDILIKHEGGNVFVAECKNWRGAKEFSRAIDQLLSYLTWRDSKVALIVFVRNRNFAPVLKQIPDIVAQHPSYVRGVDEPKEGLHRSIFHLPMDELRHVQLAVMLFHLPN